MGCSPRGTLTLFRMAQARAFLEGRDYAIPEDVKAVAVPALAHRLALDTKAKYSGVQKEDVVRELLGLRARRGLSVTRPRRPGRAAASRSRGALVVRWYEERLTAARPLSRVRPTLAARAAWAPTRGARQVYVLFAIARGRRWWPPCSSAAVRAAAGARCECRLPARATARVPLVRARGVQADGRPARDLRLSFPRPIRWGSSCRLSAAARRS